MPLLLRLLLCVAAALALPERRASAADCVTVAVRNDVDASGDSLLRRFSDHVAVAASGDVAFVARGLFARQRLYLHRADGSAETVAEGGGFVGAESVLKRRPFSDVSLNDSGDLVFRATLESGGPALFARRGNGPVEIAVRRGDVAPLGASFEEILEVGRVSPGGLVPFLATTMSGASAAFVHDLDTDSTSVLVSAGDAVTTPPGRTLCSLKHAHVSDDGVLALRANARNDCGNPAELALEGVYRVSAGSIEEVAVVGSPAPLPMTSYEDVVETPRIGGLGHLLFLAKLDGAVRERGLFRWDGSTTTAEAVTGREEPSVNGTYRFLDDFEVTSDGRTFVLARFRHGFERQAVVQPGDAGAVAIGTSSTPPVDRFALGATYRTFDRGVFAVSSGGEHVVVHARIEDAVYPKNKSALVRCSVD